MKKGFTLVELLVVITIMSILTVITVGQFQTARSKANDVARKADLSSLGKALQMYYADYGKFPDKDNGQINGTTWGGTFEDNGYVYMKVIPKDRNTSWSYCYKVSLKLDKFGLYSKLENDKDSDYRAAGYSCNNLTNYNFTIVSPNASPLDRDLQP